MNASSMRSYSNPYIYTNLFNYNVYNNVIKLYVNCKCNNALRSSVLSPEASLSC